MEAAAAPFLAAGMLARATEAVQLVALGARRGAAGAAPAATAALEVVAVFLAGSSAARSSFFAADGRTVGLQVIRWIIMMCLANHLVAQNRPSAELV